MIQAAWSKYDLNFKIPAATSRGVMHHRPVWYVFLTKDNVTGIGECAPLAGLSLDSFQNIESQLNKVCRHPQDYLNDLSLLESFPAIRCALEMANHDLSHGGQGLYFHSSLVTGEPIDINGLIWMGDKSYMLSQIREKLDTGWSCIKIKIGGLDFSTELDILTSIRQQFSAGSLELRLDANGAFSHANVMYRLQQLAKFEPHSIEQPIATGQFDLLARLCKNAPIPIALDEELIPLTSRVMREKMLNQVQPQYLVLKPSLLGGFSESEQWIELAKEKGFNYWVTSALESNIGLQAISQWTAKQKLQSHQGLGTGQLFNNNLPSALQVKSGKLFQQTDAIWSDVHPFIAKWLAPKKTVSLYTSGSTGKPKRIQMNKSCMQASAKLTADTFKLNAGDKVLLCLPVNYVAGKMMLVRAIVLQLELMVIKPSYLQPFLSQLQSQPIKFAAMTPMQLERLLQQSSHALDKIKILIIGGASVSQRLLCQIRSLSLSTHIFETYGMTETVSHVAIRGLNMDDTSDYFNALAGVTFEQDQRDCLVIHAQHLADKGTEKMIVTNDLVELVDNKTFQWLGRVDRVINSGGIKIIPEQVEKKLTECLSNYCFYIVGMLDEAFGEKVVLVIEGRPTELGKEVFKSLHPYEKPRETIFIEHFQRTESGKVMHKQSLLDREN